MEGNNDCAGLMDSEMMVINAVPAMCVVGLQIVVGGGCKVAMSDKFGVGGEVSVSGGKVGGHWSQVAHVLRRWGVLDTEAKPSLRS